MFLDAFDGVINLLFRGIRTEGEAQRTVRLGGAEPHGRQHGGHLLLVGAAGAAAAGSLGAGELSTRWKRRELLVAIYASRGVVMALVRVDELLLIAGNAVGEVAAATVARLASLMQEFDALDRGLAPSG